MKLLNLNGAEINFPEVFNGNVTLMLVSFTEFGRQKLSKWRNDYSIYCQKY